ncbi:MAG: TonB-dependent receptor, partial [Calditrichaeota bacterium]
MLRRLLLLFFLTIPLTLFAQSSGKITGFIQDKQSGEPLVGVNVILEGTSMGAMSDVDGYYVVLNVPVGTYTLRANYIGYQDVVVENVRVSAGITTNINFELSQKTLELEEAVVVMGERPLVEKNVTQSYSLVTSESIESLPVRGLNDILNLQPSVVVQDGAVHIRGGRSEEVGYYLDGASTVNPVSNNNALYIIQDAIEEVQVLTGGYGAEFGGANSGIVKSELRTGGKDFHASLDFQTDRFAGEGEQFLGTYAYQDHYLTGTFSGPLFSDNVRFFAAVENSFIGDTKKRFSKGYTFTDLIDSNPKNAVKDTIASMSYPDGFTPGNDLNRWALNSTVLFDFQPFQFRLSAVYNFGRSHFSNQPMLEVLNERDQYTDVNTLLLSGKLTHVINPTTYYDLKVSYFNAGSETFDDYFGNDWRAWNDSSQIAQKTNGAVTYRSAFRAPYDYKFNGFFFSQNGKLESNYAKTSQNYFSGALDFVTQYNKEHEIKAGFDVRSYTLRQFVINPTVMETIPAGQSETDVPQVQWKEYLGNTYGYDFYGNELDNGFDGAKKPLFAAAYLQDKIEYQDLIINAGVRLDYFDTDDRTLKNPGNPEVDENNKTIAESAWEDVKPFVEVSPRLGFSFPVSDKTVFYTQYGKFVQMPQLNDVYYNSTQFGTQIVSGGNYYTNPIGFGIQPMRTTSYEIGFRQQVGDNAAFDITGFYKNVKGQPAARRQFADAGALITTYNYITNGDFATTKGLEFKLTLRRTKNLLAQLNYTYTQAEGTGSGETAYLSAVDRNSETPTIVSPLDFNQRHRGSVNLDYRFGPDEGGAIFNNFGANLLFTFNSG